MKRFIIEFKVTDHFADDAGYKMPNERIIVEAVGRDEAIRKFCSDMGDCSYSILDVRERTWSW